MSQEHIILINNSFSASSQQFISNSLDIDKKNNYYFNNEEKYENIVEEHNVRGFLSYNKEQPVVRGFFSYLTGNTDLNSTYISSNGTQFNPTAKYKEIYYSDKKLAELFNDYYNNSIIKGVPINTSYIDNQFFQTSKSPFKYITTIKQNNYYLWGNGNAIMPLKFLSNIPLDIKNSTRNQSVEEIIVKTPLDENYFVNVFLEKTHDQTARNIYEVCNDNKIQGNTELEEINVSHRNVSNSAFTGTQIVQCFVDLNNKQDENEFYAEKISSVQFETESAVEFEGVEISVNIELNSPATGNEIATVNWVFDNPIIKQSNFEYGVPLNQQQIVRFSQGQQTYTINLKTKLDTVKNPDAYYRMYLSNLFNVKLGNTPQINILVKDKTEYNKIMFLQNGNFVSVNGEQYVMHETITYNGVSYELGEFTNIMIENGVLIPIHVVLDTPSKFNTSSFSINLFSGNTFGENESADWEIWEWKYNDPKISPTSIQNVDFTNTDGYIGNGGTFKKINKLQNIVFLKDEQIKTFVIKIYQNDDHLPGRLTTSGVSEYEYFDMRLTDLNILDYGNYIGTRIRYNKNTMNEVTDITPTPITTSVYDFVIPDYYYSDLNNNEVSPTISNALIFDLFPLDLKIGESGPRMRDYIREPDEYNNDFIKDGTLLYDINGNEWSYTGYSDNDQISILSIPSEYFWLDDISAKPESTHPYNTYTGSSKIILWAKTGEQKNVAKCMAEMSGYSENITNSSTEQHLFMDDNTFIAKNSIVNNGMILSLNKEDVNTGNIRIGPPVNSAQKYPTVTGVTFNSHNGTRALSVDYYNNNIQIEAVKLSDTTKIPMTDPNCNYHDTFIQLNQFNNSPGFRFFVKFATVSVPKNKFNGAQQSFLTVKNMTTNQNAMVDLAVFYLISGLNKSWSSSDGKMDSNKFANTIQRNRRVDKCGNVWEWCYRFTSPIKQPATPQLNVQTIATMFGHSGIYSGWGWYKMMNLVTGEVFDGEQIIDVNGNEVDGVPFDFNDNYIQNYPTDCVNDFENTSCN